MPLDSFLVRDLRATHSTYADEWSEWIFLVSAYEGVRQLVDIGVIKQHVRELDEDFLRRISELYGLNYSRAVIDLVNFYLHKREPMRKLPKQLAEDEAWQAFIEDCNHEGDTWGDFMADQGRWASVMGAVGFLIDKPNLQAESQAQERELGIYPYLSVYHPPAILDWAFRRNAVGRLVLSYLKLKDDSDEEELYRIWYEDRWELWKEPETEDGEPASEDLEAELVDQGANPLGEIPFVWQYNLRSRRRPIGVADIHEIARIDLSIIRDLSQISEIIGFNAFPILLAPMLEEGEETQDEVGPVAIIEFDPEHADAKPEWLRPAAEGVIKAIWDGIDKKARECYRLANTGGLQAVETASVAKSGTALSAEFQQLNAKIVQKAVNTERAENGILYFWLRWQQLEKLIPDSKIVRSRDYDVKNLAQDLQDALTAKTVVRSDTFKQEVEKNVAHQMLPTADDETMEKIEGEIMTAERDVEFGLAPAGQEPGSKDEEDETENPFMADGTEDEDVEEGADE
jgi:hypothetical protein